MAMLVKELRAKKVELEMLVNDPGIVTFFKELHSPKAHSPMDVTDSGIVTLSKELQSAKVHGSMIVSDSGRAIRAKDLQPAKAFSPHRLWDCHHQNLMAVFERCSSNFRNVGRDDDPQRAFFMNGFFRCRFNFSSSVNDRHIRSRT